MSTVLVLRTCKPDGTSYNGFTWPESGPVSAPDWSPEPHCGNGLHGLLWGQGDGSLLDWDDDALWKVVEVSTDEIVDLVEKVKFRHGNVIYSGSRFEATSLMASKAPAGTIIVGGTATAGYNGTATAGDYGTATAGDYGTATTGDYGTATTGDYGTATAGSNGTATAGSNGTATAGDYGTATAGDYGILIIKHWDVRSERFRIAVGYVGEDGLLPGRPYQIREGKFSPANEDKT